MNPDQKTDTAAGAVKNIPVMRHAGGKWLLVTLVLLLLIAGVGYDIYRSRNITIENEQSRLLTQARAIEVNLDYQVRSVQTVLRALANDSGANGMNQRLAELSDAIPGIRTLLLLDKNGRVAASNRRNVLNYDFSGRPYFSIPQNQQKTETLYVSPPFKTVLNEFVINLSVIVPGKDGRFNGIIAASLDPAYFNVLLKSVHYTNDMWSSIMHSDGLLFMMVPEKMGAPGTNLAVPGTFFTRHKASGKNENVFRGTSYLLGGQRIVALRTFNPPELHLSKPLIIAVSRDMESVLTVWRFDAFVKGSSVIFLNVSLILSLFYLQRRQKIMDQDKRLLYETEITLQHENHALKEWRDTFDAISDSIALIDTEQRFVRCNRATSTLLEREFSDIIGQPCWKIFHNTDAHCTDCPMEKVKLSLHSETSIVKNNDRWLKVTVDPILSDKGELTGAVHIVRDVTEKQELENVLLKQTSLMNGVLESSDAAVFSVNQTYCYTSFNSAHARIMKVLYNADIRPGDSLVHFMTHDDAVIAKANLDRVLAGESFIIEAESGDANHQRTTFEISHNPIKDTDGSIIGAAVFAHDITARKKASEEMRDIQIQLQQNDKLATIGQLAAGVAHEINNPMGFVGSNMITLGKYIEKYNSYIGRLEQEACNCSSGVLPEQIQALRQSLKLDYVMRDISVLIDESNEGIERVKRIVQDLRTFSRADSTAIGSADLNKCLDSTINIVINEIKYAAELKREYAELPKISCNIQQINQVFMNLLINAAHAIQTKGEEVGEIVIRTWSDQNNVFVSVSDTGCGIAPENCDKIFNAFYTTKDVGKGTGLGLSISSSIIRKHDGEMTVVSEVGVGSTFTIRLPLKSPQQRPDKEQQ